MTTITDNPKPPPIAAAASSNEGARGLKGDFIADVMRPSALGPPELAAWRDLLAANPLLHRAFLAPEFALACEQAGTRAFVAVLHRSGAIEAFLPFQFRSAWHQRTRLAERIGGNISDAAGLVADSHFRTDQQTLLQRCGLGVLHVTHLMEGQERYGLDASWSETSFITELDHGPSAYFTGLSQRNRDFVRDTERRLRKATAAVGKLRLVETFDVSADDLAQLIAEKRLQYHRTGVEDPFRTGAYRQLLDAIRVSPSPNCRLTLARLEAGDRVLAQHLGLRYRGALSWWFPVYDHDAQSLSPGRLLLWKMIEAAQSSGTELVDYGAGDAQYKRQFATSSMRVGAANWTAGSLRSLPARICQSIEWRWQRATSRMGEQAN